MGVGIATHFARYSHDVWLYDMSTSGTYVDGERVATKSFLLGRCAIKAGGHTFYVKSDRSLLL